MNITFLIKSKKASVVVFGFGTKSQLLNQANEIVKRQEDEIHSIQRAIKQKEEELEMSIAVKRLEHIKYLVQKEKLESQRHMIPSEREAEMQLSKIAYSIWEKVSVLKQKVITRDDELELQNEDSILSNCRDGHNSSAKRQIGRVHLSPTIYEIGDWMKFKRGITTPVHGWLGAKPKSVGFVQIILEKQDMIVTFCFMKARVLASEVVKLIPLDRDQHVRLMRDVREPRFSWCTQSREIVGTVLYGYMDGILRVRFPRTSRGLKKSDPAEIERVEELKIGDCVRVKTSVSSMSYGWEDITLKINVVMHNLEEDGDAGIAFCFRSKQFSCSMTDSEKVKLFHEEQEIHTIPSITQRRLGWSNETPTTIGKILRLNMDGTPSAHVSGIQILWKVSPRDAELLSVCEGSDWVCSNKSLRSRPSYDWFSVGRDSIVVVKNIQEADYLELAGCFRKGRWSTHYTDLEKIPVLHNGQFVHFAYGLTEPRSGWRGAKSDSRGIITTVNADGEERITFFDLSESGSIFRHCDHVSIHEKRGDTLTRAFGKIKLREMRDLNNVQYLARNEFKLKGENVGLSLKEKET